MIQNSTDPLTFRTEAQQHSMYISRNKLLNHRRIPLMVGRSNKLITSQTLESLYLVAYHGPSRSRSLSQKANKTFGLVKKIFKDIHDPRRFLCCSLVRPKLEYASNVWSSNTIKVTSDKVYPKLPKGDVLSRKAG